jgi:hypothetical protein
MLGVGGGVVTITPAAGRKGQHMNRPACIPVAALCLVLAASIAGAACAPDSSRSGVAVRDSAGIAVVESATSAWGPGDAWQVDPRPAVDIGVVDGPDEYTLSGVSGAVRLADGRIVVANRGTQQLRVYDARGVFLNQSGGAGDGPEEYRYLHGVFRLPDDTIVGWDDSRVRALFYTPNLEYVGATQSTRGGEAPRSGGQRLRWIFPAAGVFADGSLLGPVIDPAPPAPPLNRMHEQQLFAVRIDRDGEWLDTIGPIACCPALWIDRGNGREVGIIGFNRRAHFAVSGDRLYVVGGSAFEVEERAANGDLQRLIRAAVPPRAVTADDRARLSEQLLAGASSDDVRRQQRERLDMAQYPDVMPAIGGLVIDRTGNIWLQRYRAPGIDDDAPATWTVLDPDGAWLGDVDLPAGLDVTDIGTDYVLGVWRDDLGVQHVRLHPLRRSAA